MIDEILDNKSNFKIYFVGIGGISMSALALMLNKKGFFVSGYDKTESEITERLKNSGIYVNRRGDAENCDLVVLSSAIAEDDPIRLKLSQLKKAVVSRGWLLARIAECYPLSVGISGTHGKTTCTCILAHILKAANAKFTLHVGGEDVDFGNTYECGDQVFITEVCEYKRNIAYFNPDIGVVLNVDDDHEESYGSFNGLCDEFSAYTERSKRAIVNLDDQNLSSFGAVTFSFFNPIADYYATEVIYDGKTLECAVFGRGARLFKVSSAFLRRHDVYNILAATAVAKEMGISDGDIKNGIEDFRGIKRRNEYLGDYAGKPIYADYAHHPSQLRVTIEEYNRRFGNIRVLFQSHTYSRTARLLNEFAAALSLAADVKLFETYAARERYDERGSYKKLGYKLKNATLCENNADIFHAFDDDKNDISAYIVLGAGDLYYKVEEFLKNN